MVDSEVGEAQTSEGDLEEGVVMIEEVGEVDSEGVVALEIGVGVVTLSEDEAVTEVEV